MGDDDPRVAGSKARNGSTFTATGSTGITEAGCGNSGIVKGAVTSHVRLDVGGVVVTASITNESVEALGLKEGASAYAVVKASDVMVGID